MNSIKIESAQIYLLFLDYKHYNENMMGYGYYGDMMGGIGLFGFITWFVVIVDLVLLGMWLWKQVSGK